MSGDESRKHWKMSTGLSYYELINAKNTIICLDDAQSSYYDNELWSMIKMLQARSACIILFGSYGDPGPSPVEVETGTPPNFGPAQHVSLQWENQDSFAKPVGLLLQKTEARDLIDRYCRNNPN